jgi:hypothetical protein
MKEFISSTEFQVGFFLGALLSALLFTFALVNWYTSNELLTTLGFYRDGKVYIVVEKSLHRQEQYYERRR